MTEAQWWAEVNAAANPTEIPASQLLRGETVAWSKTEPGINGERVTSGVSERHRHLFDGRTYCGLEIPETKRRVERPHDGLKKCQRCDYLNDLGVTPEMAFQNLTRSVA